MKQENPLNQNGFPMKYSRKTPRKQKRTIRIRKNASPTKQEKPLRNRQEPLKSEGIPHETASHPIKRTITPTTRRDSP